MSISAAKAVGETADGLMTRWRSRSCGVIAHGADRERPAYHLSGPIHSCSPAGRTSGRVSTNGGSSPSCTPRVSSDASLRSSSATLRRAHS